MKPYATCGSVATIVASLVFSGDGQAQVAQTPQLRTNQAMIEEVMRPPTLAIDDPLAVFAFVLANLPARVTIYPTEGYYYFGFTHQGVNYSGNIRLDASDRDQGKLHFGYSEENTEWGGEPPMNYRVLDAKQGVAVEKLERLVFRVTHRDKSVIFALNDLSDVKPPPGVIAPRERYIGPVFDESGIRLFLVYNPQVKNFHYLLDDTVRASDQFSALPRHDRILIGKRTGFAFYRDHRLDRKILIGVFEGNSHVNNHLDGPFDQLPDSFIEGETLRSALIEMDPTLKGQIDRFGAAPDGEFRYAIVPYFHYGVADELRRFDRCAVRAQRRTAAYYKCFVSDQGDRELPTGQRPQSPRR